MKLITFLISGVFFIIFFCNITLAHIVADETKTMNVNDSVSYQILEIEKGDLLNYEIRVTNDDHVDILLMNSSDHDGYLDIVNSGKTRNISYIANGSFAGINNEAVRNISIPESGDYYLVIDNTYHPEGWTIPKDKIEAYIKIDHQEVYDDTPQTFAQSAENPRTFGSPGFEPVLAGIMTGFAFIIRKYY